MSEPTTTGVELSGYVPEDVGLQEVADLIATTIDDMQTGHDAWFGPLLFVRVGAAPGLPPALAPGLLPGYRHVMAAVLIAGRITVDEVMSVVLDVHAAISRAWNARWPDSRPATLPVDALTWAKMRDACTHWARSRAVDPELEAVAHVAMETPVSRIRAWRKPE